MSPTLLLKYERLTTITKLKTAPIAMYSYGSTGISNCQVVSVSDNLSGEYQSISYVSSGGGIGQVSSITETNGTNSYTAAYTYTSVGDKDSVTYVTQSALGLSDTVKWKYEDYTAVGTGSSSKHVFQTLVNIDPSTANRGSEEFHYLYTHDGRPIDATFAMTPESGYSPNNGTTYYPATHNASTRGRTHYEYDSGGRVAGVYTWWDTKQTNGTYSSAPVRANECSYETSSLNRALKVQSKLYNVNSGVWNLQRTESYAYDANSNYLTNANYGDGLANQSVTWTYDDAGNRTSDSSISGAWSYDNLNRMTASPNHSYTDDILGNRLADGPNTVSQHCTWDDLNRMIQLDYGSGNINTYTYRADGLRVSKSSSGGASAQLSTLYRYDGQMGIEDVDRNSSGTITAVNRYALGARGIEAISRTTSSGNSVAYPMYDAHGNNVGLLSRSGASWSISDERTYDAWGQVRSGGSTTDQKGRYCANLGHKQDDESGLVYMRARYYEPGSGRFIREDPANSGRNWYIYCNNSPESQTDSTGKFIDILISMALEDALQQNNGTAVSAASQWGKEKIIDAFTKELGRLCGAILGMELEDLNCAQYCTNCFLYLGVDGKHGMFGIDFMNRGLDAHGLHIDVYNDWAQKCGGNRIQIFIDGLEEGLESTI